MRTVDMLTAILLAIKISSNNIQKNAEILVNIIYLNKFAGCFTMLEKVIIGSFMASEIMQNHNFLKNIISHMFFTVQREPNYYTNILEHFLLMENNIFEEFKNIKTLFHEYYNDIAYSFILLVSVLSIQFYLRNKVNKNMKRKIFHFGIFFFLSKTNKMKIDSSLYLSYILLHFSVSNSARPLFKSFINNKENGKYILSHIMILFGCLFPIFFLDMRQYHSNLISLCFQDSVASIVGKFRRKKEKSLIGTFFGIISGLFVFYFMYNDFSKLFYFIFMGIVEFNTEQNDNIIIPFYSIVYFKYFECFIKRMLPFLK
ncbi:hypothetical protein EDEG_03453 [Edhazardia aedis USNM 41457]|uniref:dolichol kinase n=1 Tax=Edhazardia aedis (strain USNM 41457) TaxID=1003232 RepID=J8ZQZ0_EDHAE|nr:hypothetical protein EDEG_03453 [Edhazardia aedis USNM 41457]|eukprot:EJW02093.1 hypothetical protein EDEG_03453 [Edhazardia aedis USNM 41457]